MTAPSGVNAADFKAVFTRDFTYGAGLDTVRDADITRAISDAGLLFNNHIWPSVAIATSAFLYAVAHCLTINIQAAGGLVPIAGTAGAENRANGVTLNKSVGQVSITYAPPPEIVSRFASLLPFWETEYGKRYVQMCIPRLVGNVKAIYGDSLAQTGVVGVPGWVPQ